jgi:UDP-glucose 4-epimerase
MLVKETILLLGGTGFIGSNIIDYVLKNDQYSKYQFVVLSRNSRRNAEAHIEYVTGDYANKNVLTRLFLKWKFTKVIHCATSTTPLSSGNNILCDVNGNLIATIGLLDVMKENGCNYILYMSSGGAVYGERHLYTLSEKEICEPVSSYGVVKLTIENYLRLYQKQYNINYLILRVSNPFGKFHVSEKQGVVNIAIRRAMRGEVFEVWGDGSQSKDYIFVSDLVKIVFLLLEKAVVDKIINVGSGKKYQLNVVLDMIKKDLPSLRVNYIASKATDVKDFCLDITLMNSLIDFVFTGFEEAIEETISWEDQNLNN